jgi:hypothetical protein
MSMTTVAATAASLACAPSAGAASSWTTPQSFAAGKNIDIVPRVGIAADGTNAAAWKTRKTGLVVSSGGPRGHFAPPRVIDRRGARDWSVAAAPDGAFLVAWWDADGLRVAARTATRRPVVVRRVVASTSSAINGLQVAADLRGGWVIVTREFPKNGTSQSTYGVRALSLDRAGRPLGPVQDLGAGQFGIDARPTQALAVDPDGRAVFTFTRQTPASFGEGTVVVTTRAHGGVFGEPVPVPGPAAEPRVAVGQGGRAVIAVARTESCAESACFGLPGVALLAAAGPPGTPFGPSLPQPRRAFSPIAALTADDAGVLVFQLKTKPSPFSKEAPVRAVAFGADGSVGSLQTLTRSLAHEAVALPLNAGRVLALWADKRRLAAALAGPEGRFRKTAAPTGPPPATGHANQTNRDLRTAGRYAIFAWEGNGRVRISSRRF